MFARVKESRGSEYLQIVENYREDGKVRQRLILYVGHYTSIDHALKLMPREVGTLRRRATHLGELETGDVREAAEETAARLEALKRLLKEHPEIRERDQAREARHDRRQREAMDKRLEELRQRSDQQ
jgi:hypothetical protein